jgi:hypothetical protein
MLFKAFYHVVLQTLAEIHENSAVSRYSDAQIAVKLGLSLSLKQLLERDRRQWRIKGARDGRRKGVSEAQRLARPRRLFRRVVGVADLNLSFDAQQKMYFLLKYT